MSNLIYPMRLSPEDRRLFQSAAKKKNTTVAGFLRAAARREARQLEVSPASLELSRAGFTLPDHADKTERDRIRCAIVRRHVSR